MTSKSIYLAADYTARTDAVNHSLVLSALAGILPLVAFFIFLMVLKWKAHYSAMSSLIVALLVAIGLFRMPTSLALLTTSQGIVFGLFPIVFIIWMAVWVYDLTVRSNRFEDLRLIFSKIGRGDMRVQALLIGFSFGGLLEALAGFGAPVAIVAAMLLAIGMKPMKAVLTTLVANTAPVAFGAMAIPVTTAGLLTNTPGADVAAMAGRQVSVLALVVPFVLCFVMDGLRGFKQVWPMALVLAVTFGGGQFLASNYFTYELTDVVACLLSLAVGIGFLFVWAPSTPEDQASQVDANATALTPARTSLALFPYLLVVVVFAVAKLWTWGIDIPARMAATDVKIPWPGLDGHLLTASGAKVSGTVFNFNWLSGPGTLLMLCGLVTVIVYSLTSQDGKYPMTFGKGIKELFDGAYRMRFSFLTIASVMGLAYVMNFSGQTGAIGAALATTGAIFPLISPVLGWIGTAVTGSATSSNALFAKMQATAAQQIGADPTHLIAANSAGAVTGKMISPQTVSIAAAAVHMDNGEAEIMKQVIAYSLGLLAFMCLLVYLQSTAVLGWMV
ncbi:L-lactate permease [Corynebacterium epidermidicanis]|uniref:L-lactate permease n=1 Tax=Corynebacterium epidermidicanis TaxID=1050174 RepID=A0A0G3GQN1_9CORY|nr:L-lactate permease [Corynebacterium epidermidicanis]AKK02865.1 L-lactate transport [Corynebacterium epidermidicanis]